MPKVVIKNLKDPNEKKDSYEDILARFCYHFPQYTYKVAEEMPAARVIKMLAAVKRENALLMLSLLEVVTASRSKKGIADVEAKYSKIIKGI